ncbi:hypothetical protein L5515_006330 [Caenorhabditis briggsae]|uniref:Uncharacterized protein n=1 Tax=Caenorhabditis briggsae TaxID=6238 RepID=A0AAE9F1C0_CAEBR|nr:hypothetical protein L5515_006330 [Caenorhabditis briggsae]
MGTPNHLKIPNGYPPITGRIRYGTVNTVIPQSSKMHVTCEFNKYHLAEPMFFGNLPIMQLTVVDELMSTNFILEEELKEKEMVIQEQDRMIAAMRAQLGAYILRRETRRRSTWRSWNLKSS